MAVWPYTYNLGLFWVCVGASGDLVAVPTAPRSVFFSPGCTLCVCFVCMYVCLCFCARCSFHLFARNQFWWVCVVFLCFFGNVCALGFWVLLSHQLFCDVDQAQQMLRPSFNAAMSAPLMYIFFICFCVPARLIRWLTINTYVILRSPTTYKDLSLRVRDETAIKHDHSVARSITEWIIS